MKTSSPGPSTGQTEHGMVHRGFPYQRYNRPMPVLRIPTFRTILFSFFLALPLISGAARAQTPPASKSFDVATIKPSAPLDIAKLRADAQAGKMPRLGPHIDASRAEYIYMTPKQLLAIAYHVKEYQVSGPDWIGDERFDIEGTIPDGASRDDVPDMLQSLLKDRFKLTAHTATE